MAKDARRSAEQGVHGYVLIRAHPGEIAHIAAAAARLSEVARVDCLLDGLFDLVLEVPSANLDDLDRIVSVMSALPGVERAEACPPALRRSGGDLVSASEGS